MHEPLPDGGMIRKLWISETDAYRDHLLRLDRDSRYRRFSGAVSDESIARHAATANETGVVITAFSSTASCAAPPNCGRRGQCSRAKVKRPSASNSPGRATASALCCSSAHFCPPAIAASDRCTCTAWRKIADAATGVQFDAELSFDFGSVIGEVDPPRSTALSLMREAMADGHEVANAILDKQSRLLKPV